MKYNIAKTIVIVFSFLSFVSCDKDFNSLGSDLIDGNHFVLETFYQGRDKVDVGISKNTNPPFGQSHGEKGHGKNQTPFVHQF